MEEERMVSVPFNYMIGENVQFMRRLLRLLPTTT